MGCWYETCAVTGLPVLPAEKCFMVVPRKEIIKELGRWWGYLTYDIFKKVALAEYGYYNDYGWITTNKKDNYDKHYKAYIKDHPDDNRPDGRSIFVHAYAMERVAAMFPKDYTKSNTPDWEIQSFHDSQYWKIPKEANSLLSLIEFANEFRIDLQCGWAHKGSQNRVEDYDTLLEIKREQHRLVLEFREKEYG